MSLRFLNPYLTAVCLLLLSFPGHAQSTSTVTTREETSRVLRVAADPNNLPFSNDRGEGFENKIAELVARHLGARLEYNWRAQRRGFFRETLKANRADVVFGVPAGFELARVTQPIYSSAYVFVTRADRDLDITSFDDPRLKDLKIGVQLIGDDGSNTPPVHALSNRNIVQHVRGYTVYGDYSKPNPPARVLEAVAAGEVDIAIVWGPLAGYFSTRENVPLRIHPVSPFSDGESLPMAYTICAGVRRGDDQLYKDIQQALTDLKPQIHTILADYNVPLVDPEKVPALPAEDDDDD